MNQRTIAVEIDCGDEMCNPCKFHNSWACELFKVRLEQGSGSVLLAFDSKRCEECIKAEQPEHPAITTQEIDAQREEFLAHDFDAEHKGEE